MDATYASAELKTDPCHEQYCQSSSDADSGFSEIVSRDRTFLADRGRRNKLNRKHVVLQPEFTSHLRMHSNMYKNVENSFQVVFLGDAICGGAATAFAETSMDDSARGLGCNAKVDGGLIHLGH